MKRDSSCENIPSHSWQSWNLQMRHFYGQLMDSFIQEKHSNHRFHVVLLARHLSTSSSGRLTDKSLHGTIEKPWKVAYEVEKHLKKSFVDTSMQNDNELPMELSVSFIDASSVSFSRQVAMIANASIVVGLQSHDMLSAIHLPLGSSENCCGVLEIQLPFQDESNVHVNQDRVQLFRGLGLRHQLSTSFSLNSTSMNVAIEPEVLAQQILELWNEIKAKPTCLLPSTKNPFVL